MAWNASSGIERTTRRGRVTRNFSESEMEGKPRSRGREGGGMGGGRRKPESPACVAVASFLSRWDTLYRLDRSLPSFLRASECHERAPSAA